MKLCHNCNEEILDANSKFCPKCGSELDETNNNTINKSKKDNSKNIVDDALNKVVNQAKIEKNYIKYRLNDDNDTQVKGDEFIISEKIANTIESITKEPKKEKEEKTKIVIDDDDE